ncbi:MAG: L,D-transpeptidase family protein [Alphaproteobacteria bacterium]|nr:L,D-transpeptidase family protein [Alphaproteobacteria bacterium]
MKGLLLLAPSALALGTARPPEPPPALPYLPLDAREVTYSVIPAPAPTPAPVPAGPASTPPAPPSPPGGALRILVSLPQQKAFVFRDGALLETAPVSTGRRGHPTPVGTFRILQKQVHHRSNLYSNAPMPYMQRLTTYGIALHAGPLPGYPASHGCIRLPWAFAKKLYAMTDAATLVTITREPVKLGGGGEETN